jgi:protein-tyrosine phosphatase
MFRFFQKNRVVSFAGLGIDLHAHWLPGIDDGAKTMDDSLVLIRALADMGYQKLVATPHIMHDMYPNTPERIRQKLAEVQVAVAAAGIPVQLYAAAEYFMDEHFAANLATSPLLTLNQEGLVLVEMSFFTPPLALPQYLFELQAKGYQPLLAHPERYLFCHDDFAQYERLKAGGCLFQVNLLSLTGYYGPTVKKIAQKLLDKGMVEYLGTDVHHARHTQALTDGFVKNNFESLLRRYQFRNHQLLA